MKKTVLHVTLLALSFILFAQHAYAQRTDAELLGFKGGVSKVYNGEETLMYEFDDKGRATTLHVPFGANDLEADITKRTDKTLEGELDGDFLFEDSELELQESVYKMYFASGRLSKITYQFSLLGESYFEEFDLDLTQEKAFSYNDKGELLQVVFDGKMTNSLDSALTEKVQRLVFTYKNYAYDEYGNWVSRDVYLDNKYQSQETRTIVYSSKYLSKGIYEKALAEKNVQQMYNLAIDTENVSADIRQKAAAYWNNHIATELNGSYKYQWEKLYEIMGSPILNNQNRTAIEKVVRQHIWETRVMTETDYQKVMNLADLSYNGWHIFDTEYTNRIRQRAENLRTDSISNLYSQAYDEYSRMQYSGATATLEKLLNIDSQHQSAQELMASIKYKQLKDQIKNNTVRESAFKDFLRNYSDSPYSNEVEDLYVEYRLDRLPKEASYSEIVEIQGLPVNNPKLAKKVKRVAKRQEFIQNRGRCIGFGFGGSYEAGHGLMGSYGELGFRIGYIPNAVNLYVGARVGQATSLEGTFFREKYVKSVGESYFKILRVTVPVQLRLNFAKNYKRAWYLGLGAEANFNIMPRVVVFKNNKPTYLKYPKEETQNWVNKITYTPRAGIGVSRKHFNFEVYGAYDLQDNFNKEYLDNVSFDPYTKEHLYDIQLKNRWRVGMLMRIFF